MGSLKPFITIDAETEAIQRRPEYPPRPVGWAIQFPGEKGRYYAFGHPEKNNCTEADAVYALQRAWESGLSIVCHHGKFDLDVAQTHHGMPELPWQRCQDTEYLIFLHDPHSSTLSLKPSAETILGLKPEERDAVKDWVLKNVPQAKKKKKEWGAYISYASGDLVGKYAIGDVMRTAALYKKLYPEIVARGMGAAYDRERRLMPFLLRAEREGIRCDLDAMEIDLPLIEAGREEAARWLRKELKAPNLNLDADKDVSEILDNLQIVTEWTWTKGGKNKAPQRSISKKILTLDKFKNQQVAMALGYYARSGTAINLIKDWLAHGRDGFIRPNWNQVRQDRNGRQVGTRSGRPSCDNPNLFAVVKKWENNKGDGYTHPKFLRIPELPLVRKYLLPDVGGLWLHRDYNQQELRVTAHFEGADLAERYLREPRFDIHSTMQLEILRITGIEVSRDQMKAVDFGPLYGQGITGLSRELKIDREMTGRIVAAKSALMPGVDDPANGLVAKIKKRFRDGKPIRTWGGREYYCEKPRYVKKYDRIMTFEYKGLNYLIQPSSADITKEAMVRWGDDLRRESRFLVAVYDEINISTPDLRRLSAKAKREKIKSEMMILRENMETVELSVPLLSDGKVGESWGDLVEYDKPEQPWRKAE